ncbi:MAG: hypothetical protein ACM3JJ_11360 [Hyphomicrobiales bacterium]
MSRPTPGSRPGSRARVRPAIVAALALGASLAFGAAGSRAQVRDVPVEKPDDIRVGLPSYVLTDPIEHPRVEYRDSLISINDFCPVRKARLDPDRDPVYVNGRPVGFCCTPCPAVFSMNPERYLPDLKVSFPDPVTPSKRAVIDSSRLLKIGQDIYFFATLETMKRFRKDPLAYCGKLTDPVTHARFRPEPGSPHVRYRGRDYWFAADSTKAEFQATPERFSDRMPGS